MNDIRRTILWVIFGFSMVLLWDKWQLHNGNKATFFPSPAAVGAAARQPEPRRRWPVQPVCQLPPRLQSRPSAPRPFPERLRQQLRSA